MEYEDWENRVRFFSVRPHGRPRGLPLLLQLIVTVNAGGSRGAASRGSDTVPLSQSSG